MGTNGHEAGRSFEAVRAAVAEPLLRGRGDVVQTIFAHIQEAPRDSIAVHDDTYQAGVLAAVDALTTYFLEALEHGPGFAKPIPVEPIEQARRAARAEVGSAVVVRRYIAGHRRLGELVLEQACRLGISDDGPAMRHLRNTQEALLEELVAAVMDEYDRERQRLTRGRRPKSREQQCAEVVRKLIDGETPTAHELIVLGYALDAWHLCVIAIGQDADKAIEYLARSLGCELLPPVSIGSETVCAWFGGQRRAIFAEIDRTISILLENISANFVIGEPARALDGWRLTHREAQAALRVARCRLRGLTRYRDVALEAAVLEDEALADALIASYLEPLEDARGGGRLRRRILRALFDAEYNKSSAAHAIGVDRDAVSNHVKEIEQRLGCQLHECQAEIDIALRIEELRTHRDAGTRQAAHQSEMSDVIVKHDGPKAESMR